MTLILAFANKEAVYQLSDTLISSVGIEIDGAFNKCFVHQVGSISALIGFTGLAQTGRFKLKDWLVDELLNFPVPNSFDQYCMLLSELVTNKFKTDPLIKQHAQEDRRLSLLITAYQSAVAPPALLAGLVTNYQNSDNSYDSKARKKFDYATWSEEFREPRRDNTVFLECIGDINQTHKAHFNPLLQLLGSKTKEGQLIDKAIELYNSYIKSYGKSRTIGDKITAVKIKRFNTNALVGVWGVDHESESSCSPSMVISQQSFSVGLKNLKITTKPKKST